MHLKFTSLQYCNAVVGVETEIQPLQLTATQMQWSMNEALHRKQWSKDRKSVAFMWHHYRSLGKMKHQLSIIICGPINGIFRSLYTAWVKMKVSQNWYFLLNNLCMSSKINYYKWIVCLISFQENFEFLKFGQGNGNKLVKFCTHLNKVSQFCTFPMQITVQC